MTEPTNAELVRRLEDTSRRLDRLSSTLETTYLRRDVYTAFHDALRTELAGRLLDVTGDIQDLKAAREREAAYRRQIMAGAAVGVILLLVNLAIATSNFIARTAG